MTCLFAKNIFGPPDPRFAGATPQPQYAPSRNFNTVHIRLELSINTEKKIIDGTATSIFRSLNGSGKLELDAVNFKILSVKDGKGKILKYSYDNKKIQVDTGDIEAGKETTVIVTYMLESPKLGIYFVGPDMGYQQKPVQVWSHSETEDARYWFPAQDMPNDKTTSEMIITVPNSMIAVSNGALAKVMENKRDMTKTFHWKMSKPHSTYLISFCAGEFAEVRDKWKDVPVIYYCQKGREDDIKRAFGKTPKMIDFFSKKIGVDYPYEKYAQIAVADFMHGGMEHTTATTQTDDALHDERAHEEARYFSEGLCAHELAHQWFGNLITCKDWSHAWLNESFATYFDALFAEHDKGKDEFDYEMYQNAAQYFDEDKDKYRRPIATNLYRRSNDLFDRHLYQKGACVLHMLRSTLGDRLWLSAIKNYAKKNQNRAVETLDFIEAIEEATGMNMKKFFDQWVFSAGHPEYKVLYFWDEKNKEANIRISQNQPQDITLFSVKIKIEFTTKTGVKTFEEAVEQKHHLFKYKLQSEPLMLRVDPDNIILKRIECIKPRPMWIYQLQFDPSIAGRIAAAGEIAKYGTNKDAKLLGEAMLKYKFWGVQAEVAALLGQMKVPAALEYLLKGLSLGHPLARRAVVAALGEFRDPKIVKDIQKFLDDKKSYLVPAEVCKTLGKTRDASVEPLLKGALARDSWLDAIRAGSVEGLAQLHGEDSIDTMKKYSEYGNEYRTRLTAIKNLAIFGQGRKDVLDKLIGLTNDRFALVQIAAANALGELRDERAVPVLEKLMKAECDSRLKRAAEDAIKKIYTWMDTDIETYRISEEVKQKLEDKDRGRKPL